MKDLFFDQCFNKLNSLKKKLDLPIVSKESMLTRVSNSTLNDGENNAANLKKKWNEREQEAIRKLETETDNDITEGKAESSDQWRQRINSRKNKAKQASDQRIEKAFEEMYINGKDKSHAEQEAMFVVWDSFEIALIYVWDELSNFFKNLTKWLRDAWDKMYGYASDFYESITDGFKGVFG